MPDWVKDLEAQSAGAETPPWNTPPAPKVNPNRPTYVAPAAPRAAAPAPQPPPRASKPGMIPPSKVPYTPAPPKTAQRKPGNYLGAVVQHAKYGRGSVLRQEGDGEDAKLTVSFPGHGLKKLIAKYAGLKISE